MHSGMHERDANYDLVVAEPNDVDDGRLVLHVGVLLARVFRHQRPHLVDVDRRNVEVVLAQVEVPHTDLKLSGKNR